MLFSRADSVGGICSHRWRGFGWIILAALAAPTTASALGGPAASDGSRLEARAVMVLGSRGNACTGTVLAPRVVITAAHCVSGSPRYAVAYREGESPVLQEVADVARHPEFKAGARVSIDLALVRLKLPLPARFSPSALDADRDDEKVGGTLTIAGFGLGREGDEASAGRLRQAGVTVLPRYFPRYFRLGRSDDGVLICRGDSGGPVFDADLRLAGIVYGKERSDGRACGTVAQAVRIAPQRAWIDGVLTRWR